MGRLVGDGGQASGQHRRGCGRTSRRADHHTFLLVTTARTNHDELTLPLCVLSRISGLLRGHAPESWAVQEAARSGGDELMCFSMGAQGGSRAVGMWEGAAIRVALVYERVVSGGGWWHVL